jgi:hypothetical protein
LTGGWFWLRAPVSAPEQSWIILETVSLLSRFGPVDHRDLAQVIDDERCYQELESNVQVHTFSSQRDADFFLEGVEASGRLEMDMAATPLVLLPAGRFGIVLTWRDGQRGLSQFNH